MRARPNWVVEEAKPLSPWRYYWLAFKAPERTLEGWPSLRYWPQWGFS
jgi:hypothetical protein